MKKNQTIAMLIAVVIIFASTESVMAQSYQQSAEAAYWDAFNREMNRVYNGARGVQRVSDGLVNGGTRIAGRRGEPIRRAYNEGQRQIRENVQLPRRYYPPSQRNNRRQ